MKRIILFVFAVISTLSLSAQCSELFISGYVEGYGNNRALEIYNPTDAPIDLSGYSIGRFSNGDLPPNLFESIQLPAEMLASDDVFVIVLDKRDSLGSGLETPVWNGYQLWGPAIDAVTMEPRLDMNGDTIYDVQYDTNNNNLHLYGDVYRDFLDLQGKADVFLCPIYADNNSMYFNGDDAVALISGTSVANDYSNVIDVIGVIGEDPGITWQTPDSLWITRDKSLTRKFDIAGGTGAVLQPLGGTLDYDQWEISSKNDFEGVGNHECTCASPNSVKGLNEVAFKMFPNPLSANELSIQAEEAIETVEVYNVLGELVYVSQSDISSQTVTLDIPNLSNGVYAVSIYFDNNKQSIQKLLIQQ